MKVQPRPFRLKVSKPQLLNLGCGRTFHSDWLNLDLQSTDSAVREYDILSGLPCESDLIDAVYHSHVLEHLTQDQGERLLAECHRVLQPGGILRIVVPDLEQIASLYLQNHDQAWSGNKSASSRYEWMKLELLDQMVRGQSGGQMGRYMAGLREEDSEFVLSRVGSEYQICRSPDLPNTTIVSHGPSQQRPAKVHSKSWRERLAGWFVEKLLGCGARAAFSESLFRSRGEVHRWMYDRYSLRTLCESLGFIEFQVRNAFESEIEGFDKFQLDTYGRNVRKPDSLFVECRKPLKLVGQRGLGISPPLLRKTA